MPTFVGTCLVTCLLGWTPPAGNGGPVDELPSVRSSKLDVVLTKTLDGFQAIRDRSTGRDYACQESDSDGLYWLTLGGGKLKTIRLSSRDAAKRSWERLADGLELRFVHEGETALEVVCRATAREDLPEIRWRIAVENGSRFPVTAIDFPRTRLTAQLGEAADDDGIVYPAMEGVLLTKPAQRFRDGQEFRASYPGKLSAQFLYLFDPEGGFYVAAADGPDVLGGVPDSSKLGIISLKRNRNPRDRCLI